MQRNVGYLQEQPQVGVMDPDEEVDPDAEFTQDQQNAQIPAMIAGAPPAGYTIIDGQQVPARDSDAGVTASTNADTTQPKDADAYNPNAPAFHVAGVAERPVTLNVPQRFDFKKRSIITPDDSSYAPGRYGVGENPSTDILSDLPAPFAHRVVGKDTSLSGALETARQIAADQPIRPAPKWWERGLAGTVGAAAGYSNAARRAAPIDIKSATEPILYPGYDGKLASWQSRMNAANEQVQNLGQQVGAQYAREKIQSEAQLKAAQAAAAMAHGQYWVSRSEQERTQWKIDPKTGELYNTISGQVAARPPTAQDRMQTALALLTTAKDPDAQSKAAYYALNGKLPTPAAAKVPTEATAALAIRATGGISGNPQIDALTPAAAKQAIEIGKDRDPLADVARQDLMDRRKQAAAAAVDQKKIADEGKIQSELNQGIRSINANTVLTSDQRAAAIGELNRKAVPALQNIQDAYARAVRGAGGTADDYVVSLGPDGNLTSTARTRLAAGARAASGPTPPAPLTGSEALNLTDAGTPPSARPNPYPQSRPVIGQTVTVDGKPAVVTGFNAQGKPIVRAQ